MTNVKKKQQTSNPFVTLAKMIQHEVDHGMRFIGLRHTNKNTYEVFGDILQKIGDRLYFQMNHLPKYLSDMQSNVKPVHNEPHGSVDANSVIGNTTSLPEIQDLYDDGEMLNLEQEIQLMEENISHIKYVYSQFEEAWFTIFKSTFVPWTGKSEKKTHTVIK